MCSVIDTVNESHLLTPLPSTCFYPHVFVSFDKASFNGVSNQVTVIFPVLEGRRQAILVDAQFVYGLTQHENEFHVSGGKNIDSAKNIKSQIMKHFPSLHFNYVMGTATDGQYRSEAFCNELFVDTYRIVTWHN